MKFFSMFNVVVRIFNLENIKRKEGGKGKKRKKEGKGKGKKKKSGEAVKGNLKKKPKYKKL